jgi:hypothetical protein
MSRSLVIGALGILALGTSACDVEKTQDGEMPDVEVEGGQLPEYDVDTPDVEVKTEEKTIEVPTVEVEEADAGKKN